MAGVECTVKSSGRFTGVGAAAAAAAAAGDDGRHGLRFFLFRVMWCKGITHLSRIGVKMSGRQAASERRGAGLSGGEQGRTPGRESSMPSMPKVRSMLLNVRGGTKGAFNGGPNLSSMHVAKVHNPHLFSKHLLILTIPTYPHKSHLS